MYLLQLCNSYVSTWSQYVHIFMVTTVMYQHDHKRYISTWSQQLCINMVTTSTYLHGGHNRYISTWSQQTNNSHVSFICTVWFPRFGQINETCRLTRHLTELYIHSSVRIVKQLHYLRPEKMRHDCTLTQ